jgi:hypothetical protein
VLTCLQAGPVHGAFSPNLLQFLYVRLGVLVGRELLADLTGIDAFLSHLIAAHARREVRVIRSALSRLPSLASRAGCRCGAGSVPGADSPRCAGRGRRGTRSVGLVCICLTRHGSRLSHRSVRLTG